MQTGALASGLSSGFRAHSGQRWLDSIDAYLQAFTQGNGEEETYSGDEPEDHISRAIGQLKDRWKHTPTPHRPELLQRLGLEAYAQWVEVFWDVLLVADYEADETTFAEVLAMVSAAGSDTQLQGEFAEGFLLWLQTLQEILAIPRLREVIEQATPEKWEQARLDYETLCQFCQTLFAPVTRKYPKGGQSLTSLLLVASTWFQWHSPFSTGDMVSGLTMHLSGRAIDSPIWTCKRCSQMNLPGQREPKRPFGAE